MDNQQVSMFNEWFIDTYPECKDYLDLTFFDVEKSSFIAKCSFNPDSGNAAKVLRIAFGSWQHQQAKVEELEHDKEFAENSAQEWTAKAIEERNAKLELQKRVDAALARANQACIGNAMFHKQFDDVLAILRGEQALKGEGQ